MPPVPGNPVTGERLTGETLPTGSAMTGHETGYASSAGQPGHWRMPNGRNITDGVGNDRPRDRLYLLCRAQEVCATGRCPPASWVSALGPKMSPVPGNPVTGERLAGKNIADGVDNSLPPSELGAGQLTGYVYCARHSGRRRLAQQGRAGEATQPHPQSYSGC